LESLLDYSWPEQQLSKIIYTLKSPIASMWTQPFVVAATIHICFGKNMFHSDGNATELDAHI